MAQADPQSLVYSGTYDYDTGTFDNLTFVNSVLGWDMFAAAGFLGGSTVIGNIEGGNIFFDHEVFVRPDGAPGFSTYNNTAPGAVNELDFHATTVGHVLAGSGYTPSPEGGTYSYSGLGMAPLATLVSGGIATGFDPDDLGSFSTTEASIVNTYRDFFQGNNLGAGITRVDVINSSWGGQEPAAASQEMVAIDGLARQNADVAFVVSAGNGGLETVAAPASGYNNISVGSLGGTTFLQPSAFSSRGLTDFYNPQTNTTLTGVRVAVDISAPGESLFLAAYLGNGGSIGAAAPGIVEEPSPTDQYFVNMDGTSYSAPIVAGGIALLKDVAKTDPLLNHNSNANAFDTRVVKSVIQAGSQKTEGWNNGQNQFNVTTQALDTTTGAGALDLEGAVDVYFLGTRDLATDGGLIATSGWDSATIDLGSTFEYVFASGFTQAMSLTVALNWFSVREFDDLTGTGSDIAFSNLDLQVWELDSNGQFLAKVGESMSTYNNTEFLRLDYLSAGYYGLRVFYNGKVYDTSDAVTEENYGLAWRAVAVPEPSGMVLFCMAMLPLLGRRRRA